MKSLAVRRITFAIDSGSESVSVYELGESRASLGLTFTARTFLEESRLQWHRPHAQAKSN